MVSKDTQLLGPDEVAQLLGVSPRTVYRLAKNGQIPFYKVGARRRFDRQEVLEAMRADKSA